tara:strand:- start:8600 stop:8788 length:189 start_codon:yes stop_codon:yes gene_type:complete
MFETYIRYEDKQSFGEETNVTQFDTLEAAISFSRKEAKHEFTKVAEVVNADGDIVRTFLGEA